MAAERPAATTPPTREEALRAADELLRRLAEWDMLTPYFNDKGEATWPTADAPYWQGEIRRTRDYIAGARA